jgi:hypothetical protein
MKYNIIQHRKYIKEYIIIRYKGEEKIFLKLFIFYTGLKDAELLCFNYH